MKAQGSLEDLTPAGGIVAIIAGILLMIMVPPSIPSSAPQLDYIIVYGAGVFLIVLGIVAIAKVLR